MKRGGGANKPYIFAADVIDGWLLPGTGTARSRAQSGHEPSAANPIPFPSFPFPLRFTCQRVSERFHQRLERAAAVIKDFFCGPILVLRDKMDCGVEFVNCFFCKGP